MFSSLICYQKISKNTYGKRDTNNINRIVPHCFVGSPKVKAGTDCFSKLGYKWSCNYYIDGDGKIGGVLPEEFISKCTSSFVCDKQSITVEMACSVVYPYKMTDATIKSFIELCIDICNRYNKKYVTWISNKESNKKYNPKQDEILFSAHRFYANKSCPGDYCFNRLLSIKNKINDSLSMSHGLGIRSSKIGTINFNELDYSKVFDWQYYKSKYKDLTDNGLKTQEDFTLHFKIFGMLEGRQGNSKFNPLAYKNNNADLYNIFGNDLEWYYAHYILVGYKEGRKTL